MYLTGAQSFQGPQVAVWLALIIQFCHTHRELLCEGAKEGRGE
jgi:hypothetical protein